MYQINCIWFRSIKEVCILRHPFIYMQLTELSEADQKALGLIVKAAKIMDDIFYEQVVWSFFFFFGP